jgi:hypothetical protein
MGVPSGRGVVRLLLDLPGERREILCTAEVSLALSEGGSKEVWLTPQPVWSAPVGGDQQVALTLDSSLLGRGDYLIEVEGLDRQVHESYYFRISRL